MRFRASSRDCPMRVAQFDLWIHGYIDARAILIQKAPLEAEQRVVPIAVDADAARFTVPFEHTPRTGDSQIDYTT